MDTVWPIGRLFLTSIRFLQSGIVRLLRTGSVFSILVGRVDGGAVRGGVLLTGARVGQDRAVVRADRSRSR